MPTYNELLGAIAALTPEQRQQTAMLFDQASESSKYVGELTTLADSGQCVPTYVRNMEHQGEPQVFIICD